MIFSLKSTEVAYSSPLVRPCTTAASSPAFAWPVWPIVSLPAGSRGNRAPATLAQGNRPFKGCSVHYRRTRGSRRLESPCRQQRRTNATNCKVLKLPSCDFRRSTGLRCGKICSNRAENRQHRRDQAFRLGFAFVIFWCVRWYVWRNVSEPWVDYAKVLPALHSLPKMSTAPEL